MKRFSQFLSEATASQAATQAKKLGLSGDGHGGWIDRAGKVVARTEKGKLKFTDGRQAKGAEEPAAGRQPSAAPAPKRTSGAPQGASGAPPAVSQQAPEGEQPQEEAPTVTVTFGRFNPPTVGHEKLLKSAKRISAGGDLKIYPSRTQDPKKNPLDPDIKVSFMKKMFPNFDENIINDSDMK